jgi:hypothetical protein
MDDIKLFALSQLGHGMLIQRLLVMDIKPLFAAVF